MTEAIRLRLLLVALLGWVLQLDVIEHLREENRVLKEHFDERWPRLADLPRRCLAATRPIGAMGARTAQGRAVGRERAIREVAGIGPRRPH